VSKQGKKELSTPCPRCGQEVVYQGLSENPYFPFCSKHCKLVDLGKWFDEENKIQESLSERIQRGESPEEIEDEKP
jgi:hypothetical protein